MSASTYYNKAYWESVRARGLCFQCRRAAPRAGKTTCEACADAKNRRAKERRAALSAKCKCVTCGQRPPERPGMSRCAECREQSAKRLRAFRAARNPRARHCNNCGQEGHFDTTCPELDQPRCRCGLRLPCESCLPPARVVATQGWGSWR